MTTSLKPFVTPIACVRSSVAVTFNVVAVTFNLVQQMFLYLKPCTAMIDVSFTVSTQGVLPHKSFAAMIARVRLLTSFVNNKVIT